MQSHVVGDISIRHPRGLGGRLLLYSLVILIPSLIVILTLNVRVGGGRETVTNWADQVLDDIAESQFDDVISSSPEVELPDTSTLPGPRGTEPTAAQLTAVPAWGEWDAVSGYDVLGQSPPGGKFSPFEAFSTRWKATPRIAAKKGSLLDEWVQSIEEDNKAQEEEQDPAQADGPDDPATTDTPVGHGAHTPAQAQAGDEVGEEEKQESTEKEEEGSEAGEEEEGDEAAGDDAGEEAEESNEAPGEGSEAEGRDAADAVEEALQALLKEDVEGVEQGNGRDGGGAESRGGEQADGGEEDGEGEGEEGGGRGWASSDVGEGSSFSKSKRLWNLVIPKKVFKFMNLKMVPSACRGLADMAQKQIVDLLAAQAAHKRLEELAAEGEEGEEGAVDPLVLFDPAVRRCKVHERAGRDAIYLPTLPVSIRLQHVDRSNILELETDFLPYLPKTDPLLHFNTCAIVANGGVLLDDLMGPQIDANEAVFRINYAPTSGPAPVGGRDLSAHVGHRTTFDFVNRPNSGMLLKGDHQWRRYQKGVDRKRDFKPPTVVLCETPDRDARREQFAPLMSKNPNKNIWMINPELLYTFRYVWHELRKTVEARHKHANFNDKPMTGWTTVMMALQMCDAVHMYGFQPYKGKAGERYHYFDSVTGSVKVHSFDMAYEMFQVLGERMPVFLHEPGDGTTGNATREEKAKKGGKGKKSRRERAETD